MTRTRLSLVLFLLAAIACSSSTAPQVTLDNPCANVRDTTCATPRVFVVDTALMRRRAP